MTSRRPDDVIIEIFKIGQNCSKSVGNDLFSSPKSPYRVLGHWVKYNGCSKRFGMILNYVGKRSVTRHENMAYCWIEETFSPVNSANQFLLVLGTCLPNFIVLFLPEVE